ncbi:UDP-N-acetylmuramoyl-L-alanyl-D-glutamate--2,6-diaminopimelate ligase [bacterium]|nr:UDP-N-acetylmuramoyl-L-alanyl-D-glutamate--2,6-diaminopimelate ligase [bacterium]
MKLKKLISLIPDLIILDHNNPEITGLVFDSRLSKPGCMFVALRGTQTDGHEYLNIAVDNGASALLINEDYRGELPAGPAIIRSLYPRNTLAMLASQFFGNPSDKLQMIGVTGTNGKTTVTYMLQSLLLHMGVPCGVIGTVGTHFADKHLPTGATTPESPELQEFLSQMVTAGIKAAALEVSSHALEWRRVEGMRFDVTVFTNLSQDHLDFHGSMDRYLSAKSRLFRMPGKTDHPAAAILNSDDPASEHFRPMIPEYRTIRTYGLENKADVTAKNIKLMPDRNEFTLICPDGEFQTSIPIPGRHNILNALASVSALFALGYEPAKVAAAMTCLPAVPGRMESIDEGQPFQVLIDYAHTPDALVNLLNAVRPITPGRVITVFGCGGDRDRSKRPIMAKAVSARSDISIVTSDNPRTEEASSIIDDIVPGLENNTEYRVIPDRRTAIQMAIRVASSGDTVVIAGKGHEDYQIVGTKILKFDDRDEARSALKLIGF